MTYKKLKLGVPSLIDADGHVLIKDMIDVLAPVVRQGESQQQQKRELLAIRDNIIEQCAGKITPTEFETVWEGILPLLRGMEDKTIKTRKNDWKSRLGLTKAKPRDQFNVSWPSDQPLRRPQAIINGYMKKVASDSEPIPDMATAFERIVADLEAYIASETMQAIAES